MAEFEAVRGLSRAVHRVQERIVAAEERKAVQSPLDKGVFLAFEVEAGIEKRVNHKLKRKPKGYLVVKTEAEVLNQPVTLVVTDMSKDEIQLVAVNVDSTGNYKFLLWVF